MFSGINSNNISFFGFFNFSFFEFFFYNFKKDFASFQKNYF